ncbi:MAG: hypothetical protein HY763_15790 [Planctomycetes bacterium]|nr:hypothetical protein [Planctomycetota bacterium]
MSLLLDANGEYVQFTEAGLDQLDALTLVAIYYANTVSSATYALCTKDYDGVGNQFFLQRPSAAPSADDWWYFHRRAGTSSELKTNANIIQANRWEWVGVVDSAGTAPKLFQGPLTSRPTEPAYSLQTTGSGSPTNDSGRSMVLGRTINSGLNTFNGRVAFLGIANRRMSDAELLTHWPRPRPVPGAGWVLFTFPCFHGTVSAIDLSGGRRHGTVNGGPTVSAAAPLPFPRWGIAD